MRIVAAHMQAELCAVQHPPPMVAGAGVTSHTTEAAPARDTAG